ncbi:MAG: hypothetical protein IPP21_07735 [Betaproteobacteria bacterium]|nr:hypothetical protein [Betaproteobacteria bacterium]
MPLPWPSYWYRWSNTWATSASASSALATGGVRRRQNLSEQAEIDALRQQIAVLDRRRSLGEMAALRVVNPSNLLTAVLSSAQAAQIGVRGDLLGRQQLDELLNRIAEGAALQCADRTDRHLRAPEHSGVSQPVDLNEVLREAVSLSEGKAARRRRAHPRSSGVGFVMGERGIRFNCPRWFSI